jgi:hypothetical protein
MEKGINKGKGLKDEAEKKEGNGRRGIEGDEDVIPLLVGG